MDAARFKTIQILSLRAVEDPTYQDTYDKICRWFSTTYHVPYDRIDTIPEETILKSWFSERFSEMKGSPDEKVVQDYETLKRSILFEKEEEEVEQSDDEWEREMLEEIKKDQNINEPDNKPNSPNLDSIPPDRLELSGIDDFYVPED